MYGIDGVEERKLEILTELPTKNPESRHLTVENAPAGVSHLPVTQNQASLQPMHQSHRPPRNYTGEMMGSLLVPTIAGDCNEVIRQLLEDMQKEAHFDGRPTIYGMANKP